MRWYLAMLPHPRSQELAQPLVEPVEPLDPAECFRRLAAQPHCLFLDSARRDPELGRYSFLACDPFEFVRLAANGPPAFETLRAILDRYRVANVAGLPPFQGGAAGLFSYDLARQLERLPAWRYDEFQAPLLAVGLYDVVVAFDHLLDKAWIISTGLPEQRRPQGRRRAARRIAWMKALLAAPRSEGAKPHFDTQDEIPLARLAPQFQVQGPPGLTSNFTPDAYQATIARAIEYIYAGDIFQVNLAQRLLFPARDDSVSLYLRLRQRNPATFAGYFDLGRFQIVSASPERLLQVRDRQVEARPIKGTRTRSHRPEADLFSAGELRQSEKDRAENVMIVDLLRNDLSRVCEADSVRVKELCRLESYEFVQHLVSIVQGRLRDGVQPIDALECAFPGGSVTGAPKVRAMEIIAELEPTARGPYCGSLGYLGFDGSLDANILIRTITAGRGWWQAPVGGGIVAASVPQQEHAETWHKAEGLLRAFEP
jgi:para-aminobenzoate synthetase component 1